MKVFSLSFLLIFFFIPIFAETNNVSKLGNFSIGTRFNLNFSQAPKDLAFGIEINSPLLFNRIGLNGEVDYAFLRGVRDTAVIKDEEVFNYLVYKIGILISPGEKNEFVRPYAKIGWIILDTKDEIFSQSQYNGIYGSFGMNISLEKINFLGLFLEVSSYGFFDRVIVEKLLKDPTFGEGIIFSIGLKAFI
ncbi:MAG: hypothetical protein ACP5QT_08635 [Brevinematia bacterium]